MVINKIDRKDARPEAVLDEVYDLLIDLDANDDQLEFPLLYAIGRDGVAKRTLTEKGENLHVLFDLIVEQLPAPTCNPDAPFQMLVSDLGYSDYLGRLAIGRIVNGRVKAKDFLVRIAENGQQLPLKISQLQIYDGLQLKATEIAGAGDIAVLAGIDDVNIGDTICTRDAPNALPRISIDEPTVAMRFMINDSPFSGREGKYVQSARIWERLEKEALINVAIHVEAAKDGEGFIVKGRGEFQLAIVLETMRREGFELCVGRPEVILKYKDGQTLEPMEHLFVECDENFLGVVTEKLAVRKGPHDPSGKQR